MKFGSLRSSLLRLTSWQSKPLAIGLGLLLVSSGYSADPPKPTRSDRTTNASGISAKSSYELKAENGPWLILAAAFEGNTAKEQAEQLANELRRDFKLTAYTMNKQFDYTQSEIGSGFDKNGNPKRMRYRDRRVVEAYAVLVGDFDSIDSKQVKDKLDQVKRIKPKSQITKVADIKDVVKDDPKVGTYRRWVKQFDLTADKGIPDGPMASAFVTRNPLLPTDFFSAPEVDRFVRKMNQSGEFSEHSLLDCPGKFTVRVATFKGEDQFLSWERMSGDKRSQEDQNSQLEQAAQRALLTMRALRSAGYEAYQFHDRNYSFVTIGSFKDLGREDANKKFTYDPTIQEIVNRFGASSKLKNVAMNQPLTPKILFDLVDQRMIPAINQGTEKEKLAAFTKHSIAFDVKPTPMAVPKFKASSIYSGTLLGKDR